MGFTPLIDVLEVEKIGTLKKGERVKLVFSSNPSKWIRASQISIIEWRLGSNKDIEIIRADYWGEDTITFEVEVTNTDALLTERLIIGLIMSANPAYFYLAHKPGIEKLAVKAVEKAKDIASWTPTAAVVVGIAALLLFFKK